MVPLEKQQYSLGPRISSDKSRQVWRYIIGRFGYRSCMATFENLRVPTTKFNLVTRKCEFEVEPTYQSIMDLHTCRLLSEEILGPTEYCHFSKGVHYGGHYGGHFWGPLGGHYGGHKENFDYTPYF